MITVTIFPAAPNCVTGHLSMCSSAPLGPMACYQQLRGLPSSGALHLLFSLRTKKKKKRRGQFSLARGTWSTGQWVGQIFVPADLAFSIAGSFSSSVPRKRGGPRAWPTLLRQASLRCCWERDQGSSGLWCHLGEEVPLGSRYWCKGLLIARQPNL